MHRLLYIFLVISVFSCNSNDSLYSYEINENEIPLIPKDTLYLVDENNHPLIAPILGKADAPYFGILDIALNHLFVYNLNKLELIYSTQNSRGKGPGEFEEISSFGFNSDTLIIIDERLARTSKINLLNGQIEYDKTNNNILQRAKYLHFIDNLGAVLIGISRNDYPKNFLKSNLIHSVNSSFQSFGRFPYEMSDYDIPDVIFQVDESNDNLALGYDQLGIIEIWSKNGDKIAKIQIPNFKKAPTIKFEDYRTNIMKRNYYFKSKSNFEGFSYDNNKLYLSISDNISRYFLLVNINDKKIQRYKMSKSILDVHKNRFFMIKGLDKNPYILIGGIQN